MTFRLLTSKLYKWVVHSHSMPTTVETIRQQNPPRPRNHPSEREVLDLRQCLIRFVPVELVNLIIEYAEYWPRISTYKAFTNFTVPEWNDTSDNTKRLYLISGLTGHEKELATRVVKKVVFKIWSHDQGLGVQPDPTDSDASWTWFEAAIFPASKRESSCWDKDYPRMKEVVDPLAVPPRELGMWKIWHLQSNIRASADKVMHEIVWTDRDEESKVTSWEGTGRGAGTGFVRSIGPQDQIALVARARFPGWVNHVERAELDIFYEVY